MIAIVSHRDSWRHRFKITADALLPLCPAGTTIQHIGSTAVPGLAAKDVIDLQISIPCLAEFALHPLEAAGYTYRGLIEDHVPAGMALASADLQKHYFARTSPHTHVHVRERGRFNQRFALLCRDYLRANPLASAAYEVVKRELAERFSSDKASYYALKDPVFDLIVAGANEWAARVGWTVPDD